MKKLFIILAAVVAVASLTVTAGTYIVTSGGFTIPANTSTNLPTLVPVGTLTLSAQYISQNYGNVTNVPGLVASGRLTFDGTNFFVIPFTWTNTATGPGTNALWTIPQTNYTIYGAITLTNTTTIAVSNYNAVLNN